MRRRVVVTGLGAVTPLGNDVDTYFNALLAGKSGVGPITRWDASQHSTHIAGMVKDFALDPAVVEELRFGVTSAAPGQSNAPNVGSSWLLGLNW